MQNQSQKMDVDAPAATDDSPLAPVTTPAELKTTYVEGDVCVNSKETPSSPSKTPTREREVTGQSPNHVVPKK